MFVVRNSICEVSIKVWGLNSDRVNGVEKEIVMLIIVIRVIVIE